MAAMSTSNKLILSFLLGGLLETARAFIIPSSCIPPTHNKDFSVQHLCTASVHHYFVTKSKSITSSSRRQDDRRCGRRKRCRTAVLGSALSMVNGNYLDSINTNQESRQEKVDTQQQQNKMINLKTLGDSIRSLANNPKEEEVPSPSTAVANNNDYLSAINGSSKNVAERKKKGPDDDVYLKILGDSLRSITNNEVTNKVQEPKQNSAKSTGISSDYLGSMSSNQGGTNLPKDNPKSKSMKTNDFYSNMRSITKNEAKEKAQESKQDVAKLGSMNSSQGGTNVKKVDSKSESIKTNNDFFSSMRSITNKEAPKKVQEPKQAIAQKSAPGNNYLGSMDSNQGGANVQKDDYSKSGSIITNNNDFFSSIRSITKIEIPKKVQEPKQDVVPKSTFSNDYLGSINSNQDGNDIQKKDSKLTASSTITNNDYLNSISSSSSSNQGNSISTFDTKKVLKSAHPNLITDSFKSMTKDATTMVNELGSSVQKTMDSVATSTASSLTDLKTGKSAKKIDSTVKTNTMRLAARSRSNVRSTTSSLTQFVNDSNNNMKLLTDTTSKQLQDMTAKSMEDVSNAVLWIDNQAKYGLNTVSTTSTNLSLVAANNAKSFVLKFTGKDEYKFGDITKELLRRILSEEYQLTDILLLCKILLAVGASFTPLAKILPVTVLLDMLNFSLESKIGGKLLEGLATGVDERFTAALLNDKFALGDITKRTIMSAIKPFTGKESYESGDIKRRVMDAEILSSSTTNNGDSTDITNSDYAQKGQASCTLNLQVGAEFEQWDRNFLHEEEENNVAAKGGSSSTNDIDDISLSTIAKCLDDSELNGKIENKGGEDSLSSPSKLSTSSKIYLDKKIAEELEELDLLIERKKLLLAKIEQQVQ